MRTFPDPENLLACHTRTLFIGRVEVISATVVEGNGWMRAFSKVVSLDIWDSTDQLCPASHLFNFICFLPILENLYMKGHGITSSEFSKPSISPPLTGSLQLDLKQGTEHITRQLLDLPNGAHFRILYWTFSFDDGLPRLALGCSETLEIVHVHCLVPNAPPADFSQAKRLKEVVFRYLRKVSIDITLADLKQMSEETRGQWMDLDRLLVQLWEVNAVQTWVMCHTRWGRDEAYGHTERFLPGLANRRMVKVGKS